MPHHKQWGNGSNSIFLPILALFKFYLAWVTVTAAGDNIEKKRIRKKSDAGRKDVGRKSSDFDMFKVYKQSSFGKLNFQNGVTSTCLFIWSRVKTNIKYHHLATQSAIYLLVAFTHIRAQLYLGRKKTPFVPSKLQSWTLPLLFSMWAQHSTQK